MEQINNIRKIAVTLQDIMNGYLKMHGVEGAWVVDTEKLLNIFSLIDDSFKNFKPAGDKALIVITMKQDDRVDVEIYTYDSRFFYYSFTERLVKAWMFGYDDAVYEVLETLVRVIKNIREDLASENYHKFKNTDIYKYAEK